MYHKKSFFLFVIGITTGLLTLALLLGLVSAREASSAQAEPSAETVSLLQSTDVYSSYLPIVFCSKPVSASPPPEDWLGAVNYYREMANLPPAGDNTAYSEGDWLHARYMVKNDYMGHSEDPSNEWYTTEGAQAAASSNVMISSNVNSSDLHAINMWMRGPFHAVGILDPALHEVGFGSYRESIGSVRMAAALDVLRGQGSISPTITFPIYFPGDGTYTPLLGYYGGESPDPLSSCPGYSAPSGPPIMLQIGDGSQTPSVTATSFQEDGAEVEHCVFDETNYTNSDSSYQSLGRGVLGGRDAIVIMPLNPLVSETEYRASITVNGSTYTWSFTAMDPSHMADWDLPSLSQIDEPPWPFGFAR